MNKNYIDSFENKRYKNARLSGLKGKALTIKMDDIPKRSEVRAVLPRHCFRRKTLVSLAYLFQTLSIQVLIVYLGFFIPFKLSMTPIWVLYAIISGTNAMGFWVLAHECGHGAFSDNKKFETFIGYILHSSLLVPYFSWQRSHAVHHRFTNHITDGETHVPVVIGGNGTSEKAGGEKDLEVSKSLGDFKFGALQLILHLIFGWPAYLLAGKTGGPRYGTSNHFWPTAPFSNKLWPAIWAKRVWLSDFGVVFTLILISLLGLKYGSIYVITMYFAPLLIINGWLVLYTWLHHTDTDVPHLSEDDFSYMRGAFLSIDRPYGPLIDFLHHRIGSTHVIHHIEPSIPHYQAKEATDIIKRSFPKVYLYNSTPVYKALWNVATNCIAVKREEGGSRYLWQDYSDHRL